MFTRENVKPVLVSILSEPEVLECNYDFFEDNPDNQEIFKAENEPLHIAKGEHGYEKRVQEVIDDNVFYLIGDEENPENHLIDYLNKNLKFIPVMSFPSEKIFHALKEEMSDYAKSDFFLEEKECELEMAIDYDNPPDFSKEVFPADELDNVKLLDKKHKYVLIDRSGDRGNPDIYSQFDWGIYTRTDYMYLRDDCKICWIREYCYEIQTKLGSVICKINEFLNDARHEYSDAFLIDIANGDV